MNDDNKPADQQPIQSTFRPGNQPDPEPVQPMGPTPNPYTLILSNSAILKSKSFGDTAFGVSLTLYSDHLEVESDNNDILLNTPLDQLKKVKKGSNYLVFVANDNKFKFKFALPKQKKVLGEPQVGASNGKATAKAWKDALTAKGVKVGTAFI